MKRIILLMSTLFALQNLTAQISIPESYYVNRAKAKILAEEQDKKTEIVVIGTQNGVLSYLIQNGIRKDFAPKPQPPKQPFDGQIPYRITEPPAPAELTPEELGRFAVVLQKLLNDKWELMTAFGTPSGEVYVLSRKVSKPAKSVKPAQK